MDPEPRDEVSFAHLVICFDMLSEEVRRAYGRLDEFGRLQAMVLAAAVVECELPSLDAARAIVQRFYERRAA